MAMESFDLAERLQTIVYVMSDLDLGMNTWMSQPFTYPDKPLDRGKVLDEAKVKELGATWGRYKDVDGDGIPWRSLPGTPAPAFFTRGSGHNEMAQYSERADDYVKNLDRLARKFDTAKTLVPAPVARIGRRRHGRHHRLRIEPLRRPGSRAISCARRPASRPRTCGCARIRSRRRSRSSSAATTACTSSSRTATGRC